MKRLICGHQFVLIATIDPDRDETGRVRVLSPKDAGGRELSDAPFCRFDFPLNIRTAGVYAVTVDDRVVYVGKTNSLSRRWGQGEYGSIVIPEPGNPQVTNRRVNHGILEAAQRGGVVQIWFHETADRDCVEASLIGKLDLVWNRQGPATEELATQSPSAGRNDWASVMRAADQAKTALRGDRARGEKLFAELLQAHPNDGMVYMKRAEAYEQAGDAVAATADYSRAERLVPFPGRKAEARAGLRRTNAG